jgi:hypothetical protein
MRVSVLPIDEGRLQSSPESEGAHPHEVQISAFADPRFWDFQAKRHASTQ